jgi:hypothetical protein
MYRLHFFAWFGFTAQQHKYTDKFSALEYCREVVGYTNIKDNNIRYYNMHSAAINLH